MTPTDAADVTVVTVTDATRSVLEYLPRVFWAVVVVLVGVLVAWAVKTLVVKGLKLIKLKPYTDAVGLNKVFPGQLDLVNLFGDILRWVIVIIFLLPALEILDLAVFTELVAGVVSYLPNVLVAVIILVVGTVLADLLARVIESTTHTIGAKTAAFAADFARWTVVVIAVLAALTQLGIAVTIISQIVTGFVAMLAIAGGLAFGLGGQGAAKEVVDRFRKNLPK